MADAIRKGGNRADVVVLNGAPVRPFAKSYRVRPICNPRPPPPPNHVFQHFATVTHWREVDQHIVSFIDSITKT
jgi:hypothetical protein